MIFFEVFCLSGFEPESMYQTPPITNIKTNSSPAMDKSHCSASQAMHTTGFPRNEKSLEKGQEMHPLQSVLHVPVAHPTFPFLSQTSLPLIIPSPHLQSAGQVVVVSHPTLQMLLPQISSVPLQIPLPQTSPSVQAFPSLQDTPSALFG